MGEKTHLGFKAVLSYGKHDKNSINVPYLPLRIW